MNDAELEAALMRGYGYRKSTEMRGEYIVENHRVVSNTLHEVEVWERDGSWLPSNPLNEPNVEECNCCGGNGCEHCDRDGLRFVDAEKADEFWMEDAS